MEDYEKKWKKKLKVNMNEQPTVICQGCKNEYWKPLVKIKVISPLLTGFSLKTYAMQQYFECTRCGSVISIETPGEAGIEIKPYDLRKNNGFREK